MQFIVDTRSVEMQEGDEDETGVIWDESEGTGRIKATPVEKIVQLITRAGHLLLLPTNHPHSLS